MAQSDEAALWLDLAELAREAADRTDGNAARRHADTARKAAINAYLRARPDPLRAAILTTLAWALEATGDGRRAIAALRLAEGLSPRADIVALLDEMIGKYGFRITDTRSGQGMDIYAQRLSATGTPVGSEIVVDASLFWF